MGQMKKWQLALFVLAVLALAGGLWYTMGRGKVTTAGNIQLVDVVTGDRFVGDTSGRKVVFLPAKNPDTGKDTLVPYQEVDGAIFIRPRWRDMIKPEMWEGLDANQIAVNPQTFEVRVSDAKPRQLPQS
ncbi:MAG: hypothetical protein H6811_06695 [Phycisphaeraceae bacterium]|nr:hypothetical protein [Phycisphaeraceae bacterium]